MKMQMKRKEKKIKRKMKGTEHRTKWKKEVTNGKQGSKHKSKAGS